MTHKLQRAHDKVVLGRALQHAYVTVLIAQASLGDFDVSVGKLLRVGERTRLGARLRS